MDNNTTFDLWCLVELFGHSKIAGRCTEQNLAGSNMLRVDVPETETHPSFTKFFNHAAIYAISPIDEKTARYMANQINSRPIDSYDVSAIVKKYNLKVLSEADAVQSENKSEADLIKNEIDSKDEEFPYMAWGANEDGLHNDLLYTPRN